MGQGGLCQSFTSITETIKTCPEISNSPQKNRGTANLQMPTRTWIPEDFIVSNKRKKPPQVTWARMPESPEEKDLQTGQIMVRQGILALT